MTEREIAVAVITKTNEKGFGNIVLRQCLGRHKGLSRVQRAFVTELVNGTFRNLIRIDYIIGRFSSVKTNKMKPLILNVLRISVYQLLFMDKVPTSAAINEACELVKKKGFKNLTGFVNGVLRNIDRNINKIPYPNMEKEPVRYLSVMYSYPEDIIKYWLESHTFDEVLALCKENLKTPKVTAAVNTLKISDDELIAKLRDEGSYAAKAKVGRGIIALSKTSDMTESEPFKKGYFHIMDQSSFMSVRILDPKAGEKILDVCAAPGGKSFLAAYMMENRGEIVSRDIYPHKIKLVESGAKRLGIDIIKTENLSGEVFKEEDAEVFDRVLVDAPCSGLGLLKRKPDIKYNKTLDDIKALAEVQRKILEVSQKYVKPGGVLVYSTCTVSPLENEDNVNWFLKNFDFEAWDISDCLPQNIECSTLKDGYINITPFMWGGDGFFVAKFRKR